ncbi:hypothetical protein JAAARDRAFT_41684 [Jaapia argillacea MUCL 33604]|uniref:Clathrin light chain n=1 Tax=Jaapia argillacea MUCL 33604 TaxID=933084 RepID=A0A067PAP1_9AGAM|nr:hypothetical protein JAAARDRAFT_41684 [Jaapia argillacea MUCL 33604]
MSDFLARENELLGGEFGDSVSAPAGGVHDDIDFDRAASAFPDISLDGDGDIPVPVNPSASQQTGFGGFSTGGRSGGFSFDDFDSFGGREQKVTEVKVTGDEDIEKFEDQFPDIGVPEEHFSPPVTQKQPSFGALPPFAPRPQPSPYTSTPIFNQPIDEDEPQVIKDWREKQQAEIKTRDEAAKAKREETIRRAEGSIDQFYEEYNTRKERNIRENKEHEATFLSSLTSSLSTGTTWERICLLIDLENSQSKTLARTGPGTTDLTRMKEVLLRLKREGDAAPGAGGY